MTVLVLLHDDYADWELGYLLPELRGPAPDPRITKRTLEVTTFSVDGAEVTSMGGLHVRPDKTLADVLDVDAEALLLPGGHFWKDFANDDLDGLVKRSLEKKIVVGAICAATGYLARLGALDEIEHTSNSLDFLKTQSTDYAGEASYKDDLAVSDGCVHTASGLGAIDFSRNILDALEVYDERISEAWYRAFKEGMNPYASA